MKYDKSDLIKYRLDRADETIEEAKMAIEAQHYNLAQNRIYYAIFYTVQALALQEDFATSKHSTLLGWFNKSFIKTGKLEIKI